MKTKNTGFTLVELLVVIALIALLAVLLVPSFSGVSRVANRTTCANNLKRI
ncbi:MAG: prepilin-type N-terminal cleavage/methylation domain-containing protein, partial [Phycisphaerae bacterium]|nr:prepilin-type N-terminal cleavage/methylation domain-containing protein [Phycisphaerae bacterium]